MTGVATNLVFDSGLRAPAAPGSIIAVWLAAPASSFVGVTLSVILVGRRSASWSPSFLLKIEKGDDEGDLAAATAQMEAMKGKKSSVAGASSARAAPGRSARSSSPATPAWAPRRWAPRCCARRSRPPATARSRWSTRRSRTSTDDLRPRGHPPGPHRAGQAEDAVGDPRLGGQLHGQPEVRRDRRAASTSPTGRRRAELRSTAAAGDRTATCSRGESIVLGGTATSRDDAITEAGAAAGRGRRGRPVVRRRDARAGDVGVHRHGQRPGDPARHQRGQGADPPHRDLVRALRRAGRLERQAGGVRASASPVPATTTWRCCRGSPRRSSTRTAVAQLRAATSADDVLAVLDGVRV